MIIQKNRKSPEKSWLRRLFLPKSLRETVERLSEPKSAPTEESIRKSRSNPKEKVPTLTINLQKPSRDLQCLSTKLHASDANMTKVLPHNISAIQMPVLVVKKGSFQVIICKFDHCRSQIQSHGFETIYKLLINDL